MSLIKYYRMLKNARVTDFTVSEFLRENQEVGGGGGRGWLNYLPSTQIKVNFWNLLSGFFSILGNKKGKELLKNFTSF